jgi:uncharacterized protein YbjT (DUF2867 family)
MTEPVISVLGGTGAQGGGVVDALLAARKFKVRVASRNPSSDAAEALTARGVEVVKADLLEPSSLKALYDGARGAFLVTNFGDPAQGVREEEIGAGAVNAARSAGVRHLIWSTLPDVEKISGGRLEVQHFTLKARVDAVVRSAGFERHTFVEAPFYFQNFLKTRRRSPCRTVVAVGRSQWILRRASSTPGTSPSSAESWLPRSAPERSSRMVATAPRVAARISGTISWRRLMRSDTTSRS